MSESTRTLDQAPARPAARSSAVLDATGFSREFQAEFRIEETLGEGAMGVVYRAVQVRFGRTVAIKLPTVSEPADVARFVREGRVLASLAHPNILRVYDAGEDGGRPFIAFELVSGCTLHALCHPDALPVPEAVALEVQLLAGLGNAHAHRVLHRDVKSENALVTAGGELKLVDFGLARSATEQVLTQEGTLMGTPAYMAPEQIQGLPIDQRADLYAAAIVLFELLTGRLPFEAADLGELLRCQVRVQPPSLIDLVPAAPRALASVLARALAKSRDERFGTAEEFAQSLRSAVGQTPVEATLAAIRRRVQAQGQVLDIAAAGPASVGATQAPAVGEVGLSTTRSPVGRAPTGPLRPTVTRPLARSPALTRPRAAAGLSSAPSGRPVVKVLAGAGTLAMLAILGVSFWWNAHHRTAEPETSVVAADSAAASRVAELVRALSSANDTTRTDAARELGQINSAAPDTVTHMVLSLEDRESSVRRLAAQALGRWRCADPAAVRGLSLHLHDPEEDVRSAADTAVASIGSFAFPALVQDLRARHVQDRRRAIRGLALAGAPDREVVDVLVERLTDPGRDVPFLAAWALGRPGVAASGVAGHAIDPLIDALDHALPEVRWRSAEALGRLGQEARLTIPRLVQAAAPQDPDARSGQVWALAQLLGGSAAEVADALRPVSRGQRAAREPELPAPRRATPADVHSLVDALGAPDKTTRMLAASALGSAGAVAADATLPLVRTLSDPDRDVRLSAAGALSQLGPAALPALQGALGNRSPRARSAAAWSLGLMGDAAAPAVPALIHGMKDPILWVRHESACALGRIGPAAKAATAPCVDALFYGVEHALEAGDAEYVLALVGAAAVPALVAELDSAVFNHRRRACEELSNLGSEARAALPSLVRCLKDPTTDVRAGAAIAIRDLGPVACTALSDLTAELKDPSVYVAWHAADAVGLLAPDEVTSHLASGTGQAVLASASAPAGPVAANVQAGQLLDDFERITAPTDSEEGMVHGALVGLAFSDARVIQQLGARLHAPRSESRVMAARVLASASRSRPDAALALVAALDDVVPQVRTWAMSGSFLGPAATDAVGPLRRLLAAPDKPTRDGAARCLAGIGVKAAPFLSDLIRVMEADRVRLYLLNPIGPAAAPATQSVMRMLSGQKVRGSLYEETLSLMGPAAIREIVRETAGSDPAMAGLARTALRDMAESEDGGRD